MDADERARLTDDLRDYAAALDADRGHAKSRVTALMREAADALADRDRVAAERDKLREVLVDVPDELRGTIASLIAVKRHLDTPYPDDPRWTPWTRFIERELRNIDAFRQRARAALLPDAPEGAE